MNNRKAHTKEPELTA